MGNCPTCLSGALVHHSSVAEEEEEEEEQMMVRVLRTTDNELFQFPGPVSVQDLLFGFHGFAVFHSHTSLSKQPLPPHTLLQFSHIYYLKPWLPPSSLSPLPLKPPLISKPLVTQPSFLSTNIGHDANSHHSQVISNGAADRAQKIDGAVAAATVNTQPSTGDMNGFNHASLIREPPSTQSDLPTPTKKKAVKKVRFAEEPVLIEPASVLACSRASNVQVHGSSASEELQRPQPLQGELGRIEGELRLERHEFEAVSPKGGVAPHTMKKEVNGVVRLRVVISKKQLTELMSQKSSAMSGDQALMEKMLAPLLSPATAPPHHSHSNWRPSLDRIPEAHFSQELLIV